MSSDPGNWALILAYAFIALPIGIACAVLAKDQGRQAWIWFLFGTCFTVAALWALLRRDFLKQSRFKSTDAAPQPRRRAFATPKTSGAPVLRKPPHP